MRDLLNELPVTKDGFVNREYGGFLVPELAFYFGLQRPQVGGRLFASRLVGRQLTRNLMVFQARLVG